MNNKRETHVKELNVWILLLQITSGSKMGVMELHWSARRSAIELGQGDIRIVRTGMEIPSNFSSHFCPTTKPHPSYLCHCLPMTALSFLVLALLAMTKVPLISGPERIVIIVLLIVMVCNHVILGGAYTRLFRLLITTRH